jgi:hypothetical protein
MYEALRDAMASGKTYTNVRFWKKKGEGFMTQEDKEQGYGGGYPILGMMVWPQLQTVRLPKWAVPTAQTDFSLDALPKFRSELDQQLGRTK